MFIINKDPAFDINQSDPAMNAAMLAVANEVARSMDEFVRTCVAKVLSPESLDLFVSMQSSVPELDLEITFFSPQKRRMRVLFRKQELGSAMSETALEEGENGMQFVHKITIERI
jgi:hypothetical protein